MKSPEIGHILINFILSSKYILQSIFFIKSKVLKSTMYKIFSLSVINMKENGTFRYIQNIAGFTGRPEVHDKQGITPKLYRPNAVSK